MWYGSNSVFILSLTPWDVLKVLLSLTNFLYSFLVDLVQKCNCFIFFYGMYVSELENFILPNMATFCLFVGLIGVVWFFHRGGKCCVDFFFFYFFIWLYVHRYWVAAIAFLLSFVCLFVCLFVLIFFFTKIRMLIVGILKWTNVSFHFQYIRKNSGGRKYVHKD